MFRRIKKDARSRWNPFAARLLFAERQLSELHTRANHTLSSFFFFFFLKKDPSSLEKREAGTSQFSYPRSTFITLSSRDEFELQIHPLELLSPLGRVFSTVNLDQEEEVGGRLQEGEISRNIF